MMELGKNDTIKLITSILSNCKCNLGLLKTMAYITFPTAY